jgi:uncharacterized membrane protein YbaN (DUF454 family)
MMPNARTIGNRRRDAASEQGPAAKAESAPAAEAGGADCPQPDALPVHSSRFVRGLFIAGGVTCVALGLAGIVLPVLPTTPFILLAAYCFARASPRLHQWLLDSRTFGPMIREWQRYRAIPWRTKLTAIALMSATMAASIVFFVRPWPLQAGLGLLGVGLAVWLYRIPSRDRP